MWPCSFVGQGTSTWLVGEAPRLRTLPFKGPRPRAGPDGREDSPALTSFHRLRRCMAFHPSVGVSESASYLPARKEKERHTNYERGFENKVMYVPTENWKIQAGSSPTARWSLDTHAQLKRSRVQGQTPAQLQPAGARQHPRSLSTSLVWAPEPGRPAGAGLSQLWHALCRHTTGCYGGRSACALNRPWCVTTSHVFEFGPSICKHHLKKRWCVYMVIL